MDRRGFLAGIFAAAAAPAICKADNLMRIIVPPEKKVIVRFGIIESMTISRGSEVVDLETLLHVTNVRLTNDAVEQMLRMKAAILRSNINGTIGAHGTPILTGDALFSAIAEQRNIQKQLREIRNA